MSYISLYCLGPNEQFFKVGNHYGSAESTLGGPAVNKRVRVGMSLTYCVGERMDVEDAVELHG